ncbi:MAG: gamma-glutamyl-gamma-aminobutyrate hydrolase family protein [Planctomycetota bacterium]|jgi:putative glutamine amidotransferase
MSERPRIGLIGNLEERRVWRVDLPVRYADAVRLAGGLPLGLYPTTDRAELEALVAELDGLVLTGGDDFDTERLGRGPTHAAAEPVPALKQDGDLALIEVALAAGLPMLGICYGMQAMALSGGATLLQHLPDDLPGSQPHGGAHCGGDVSHRISTASGSKLASVVGVDHMDVVSRHHQAIGAVGTVWAISARDDEGLIEAVEHPEQRFALGVQWHPELSPVDHPDRRLFSALIEAARERAALIAG